MKYKHPFLEVLEKEAGWTDYLGVAMSPGYHIGKKVLEVGKKGLGKALNWVGDEVTKEPFKKFDTRVEDIKEKLKGVEKRLPEISSQAGADAVTGGIIEAKSIVTGKPLPKPIPGKSAPKPIPGKSGNKPPVASAPKKLTGVQKKLSDWIKPITNDISRSATKTVQPIVQETVSDEVARLKTVIEGYKNQLPGLTEQAGKNLVTGAIDQVGTSVKKVAPFAGIAGGGMLALMALLMGRGQGNSQGGYQHPYSPQKPKYSL